MWKFPPFSSRLKIGKKTWKFNKMLYRMLCLASGKVKQWFVTLIHGWTSSGICPNVVIGGGQVAGCSLRIQTTSDYRSSIQWVTVGSRIFRLEKAVECGRFLHDSFAYDLAENVSTWRSQCSGLWNGGSLASSFKWSGTSRGQLCRWHASVSRTVPTMGPSSIGFGRLLRQITDSTTNRLRCSISSPQFIHWSFFLKKNNNLMTSVSPESDPPDLPFRPFFSPKNGYEFAYRVNLNEFEYFEKRRQSSCKSTWARHGRPAELSMNESSRRYSLDGAALTNQSEIVMTAHDLPPTLCPEADTRGPLTLRLWLFSYPPVWVAARDHYQTFLGPFIWASSFWFARDKSNGWREFDAFQVACLSADFNESKTVG